jgi:hypothetical protein
MEPIKAVGELLQKVDSCINDPLKLTLDSITSTQIQQLYNSLVKLPSPEDLGKKISVHFSGVEHEGGVTETNQEKMSRNKSYQWKTKPNN